MTELFCGTARLFFSIRKTHTHDCHHRAALQGRLRQFAIGAYNINNAEADHGPLQRLHGLEARSSSTFQRARNYTDKRMLEAIIRSAEEIFPEAIYAVHLESRRRKDLLRLHRQRLLQLGDDRRVARSV